MYTMKFSDFDWPAIPDYSALAETLKGPDYGALAETLKGPDYGALAETLKGPDYGALAETLKGPDYGALAETLKGPDYGALAETLKGPDYGALAETLKGPDYGALAETLKGPDYGALAETLKGPDYGALAETLKGPDYGALTAVATAADTRLAAALGKVPDIGLAAVAAATAQGPSFGELAAALPSFGELVTALAQGPSFGELATLAATPDTGLAAALAQGPSFNGLAELFGPAWDERIEAAVGRLDRVEDIVADASEPERAVEDLVEDAATVQEAAPPEAKDEVDRRVWWFLLWLADRVRVDPALEGVRETMFQLIVVLLVGTGALPVESPAPATNLGAEAVPTALTLPSSWAVEGLPAIVERAGPAAAERVVEFFTDQIRNPNTRAAYVKAVTQFFNWCDERGLELNEISPVAVAAYVEELQGVYRAPTIKQHLAAIRRLFDWLVVGQVVPWNPTAAVRGPTHVVK